ncbi:MAG: HupE/UreJ family protein [Acidimicrobiales bacterium]|nr:HupE/UreJ family protein [Acidimicrobiales bacterium]
MRSLTPSRLLLVAGGAGTAAAVLAASPAGAHTGRGAAGAADGLLHPVTGPDHLLAMVAVGVVAALAVRGRAAWAVPGAFLGGMVLGGAAGLAGAPLPGAELVIAGSVVVLGLAIVAAVELRGRLAGATLGLLALAGVAHGHAHGAEAPTSAHPVAYVAAFALATALLHVAGMGIGTAIRERGVARLGLGAATAVAGLLLLG